MEELIDLLDRVLDSIVLEEKTQVQLYVSEIVERIDTFGYMNKQIARRIIRNLLNGHGEIAKIRLFLLSKLG